MFYIFDLDKSIEDIQEQYPLLDIEFAKELAEEAGIKYPPNRNNEPHVLTSDYFLSYKDGKKIALTIKPLKKINKRQLELFEIERRYWDAQDVQWKIITEKEMPGKDLLQNYKDIHSSLVGFIKDSHSDKQIQEMLDCICTHYESSLDLSLPQFTTFIDFELNIEEGSALRLIKALVANGLIEVNLEEPLVSGHRKMKDLNLNISNAKGIRKSDLAA